MDTPELSFITMTLVVLGCTTMLFLTGVLVQLITQSQINKTKGHKRMSMRSHGFQRVLHKFGIELEVVTAAHRRKPWLGQGTRWC